MVVFSLFGSAGRPLEGKGLPAATSHYRILEALLLYRSLIQVSAHYGSHVWSKLLIQFTKGAYSVGPVGTAESGTLLQ